VKMKSWTRKDFVIDWFSGTGAGGQHRNRHQNCVRITHKESGITTVGQNHRERRRNLDEAFQEMGKRLSKWYWGEEQKERAPFGETRIRTYNECENYVKDHRTDQLFSYKGFELDQVIGSVSDDRD